LGQYHTLLSPLHIVLHHKRSCRTAADAWLRLPAALPACQPLPRLRQPPTAQHPPFSLLPHLFYPPLRGHAHAARAPPPRLRPLPRSLTHPTGHTRLPTYHAHLRHTPPSLPHPTQRLWTPAWEGRATRARAWRDKAFSNGLSTATFTACASWQRRRRPPSTNTGNASMVAASISTANHDFLV